MVLTELKDALLGDGDTFHFFMPLDSMQKSEDESGKRFVQGIASTDHRDLQGEVVSQRGIDYEYFLTDGYINDDHKDGPENKVGEPVECKMTKDGLWIKAFLYKGKERSEHWWEHINTLASNGSKRKVGFSIQGKILRREGKTIAKCWLQDVAITASPVNTNTWAEIVKSLNAQKWCIHPSDPVCKGGCCICPTTDKSLEIKADTINVEEVEIEQEEKALSTAGGASLVPQSLEGSAKVQTFKSVDRYSFEEAVQYIQKAKGYSYHTAKALADAIFVTHGMQ